MRYVIVDLEATCWDNKRRPHDMEIIEIGAVELLDPNANPTREFSEFVRPVSEPILSEFCVGLTSIQQRDVDHAATFPVVFQSFIEWIGPEPFQFCSWGRYDYSQFQTDCLRHGVEFPESFQQHINLKQEFASQFSVKSCGMKRALTLAGIPLEGTHHRGIDDARNIAKLARLILPATNAPD